MDKFYEQYYPYVLRYFKARMGADNPEAEDLASDVVLKAWQSYPTFEGKSTIIHWIHRIAVNKYLDYYRRKKIVTFFSLDTGSKDGESIDWNEMYLVDENSDPADAADKEELKITVRNAVDTLKPHHREVVSMYYFKGMEVDDIAKVLDVPLGTIKSRLFRARESLEKILKGEAIFQDE
jgi:RNA polymerase sigma-70 factor (ECF subfamily)